HKEEFTTEPFALALGVGVGYGIAIAVNILVLISTIMLASYACVKVKGSTHRGHTGDATSNYYEDRNHRFSTISSSTEPMVVLMSLDDPTIGLYPKLVLGENQRLPQRNDTVCSICLSEYKPQDQVWCIPDCYHCFHAECIDEWLRMSATCLVCRNSPAPSAGPSPLSDLVPLAFNARVFIFKSLCDLDSNFLLYAIGVVRTNNLQLSTTNF
ncbi:putative RING-H2 finger protein ATL69, partial [Malus domestica]|uniref:putative RING-H2 finger protein ATL69 n=2 Tax=Malus TaxID=3749 RepID=UPI003975DC2C